MLVRKVADLDLPELEPYRTLRRPLEHARKGIFVAEGDKVVRRLLESSLELVSVLLTPQWYQKLLADNRYFIHEVFVAEKELLETIVGYPLHQGVMAVAKIPEERSWPDAFTTLTGPMLLVALDGIVNAENVGIIVRNCAAFGVHAIFVGKTSSSPYLRRAVRNSMGSVFRIPIFHSANLAETLSQLRQGWNVKIIATTPHENITIHDVDLTGNVCFVFGNEGAGISEPVLTVCTHRAAIPMRNQTDSINVSTAAAVFLYEFRRRVL